MCRSSPPITTPPELDKSVATLSARRAIDRLGFGDPLGGQGQQPHGQVDAGRAALRAASDEQHHPNDQGHHEGDGRLAGQEPDKHAQTVSHGSTGVPLPVESSLIPSSSASGRNSARGRAWVADSTFPGSVAVRRMGSVLTRVNPGRVFREGVHARHRRMLRVGGLADLASQRSTTIAAATIEPQNTTTIRATRSQGANVPGFGPSVMTTPPLTLSLCVVAILPHDARARQRAGGLGPPSDIASASTPELGGGWGGSSCWSPSSRSQASPSSPSSASPARRDRPARELELIAAVHSPTPRTCARAIKGSGPNFVRADPVLRPARRRSYKERPRLVHRAAPRRAPPGP